MNHSDIKINNTSLNSYNFSSAKKITPVKTAKIDKESKHRRLQRILFHGKNPNHQNKSSSLMQNKKALDLDLTTDGNEKPKTRNYRVLSSHCMRETRKNQIGNMNAKLVQNESKTRPISAVKQDYNRSAILLNKKGFVGDRT